MGQVENVAEDKHTSVEQKLCFSRLGWISTATAKGRWESLPRAARWYILFFMGWNKTGRPGREENQAMGGLEVGKMFKLS